MIGEVNPLELQQQYFELQREVERLAQSEAEARRQLEELNLIFDASPIMFWYKDRGNRHIRVNQAAAELEGLPISAIEGRSAFDIYPQAQAEAYYKADLEVINSGQPKLGIIEKHHSPRNDQDLWTQVGKVPIRDKNGTVIGVVVFAMDISEQKRAELAAVEAQANVERQNQQFNRVHTFLRSTLYQLADTIERGADRSELITYLRNAEKELNRIEQDVG
ncbi:MAG: PAS domain-containing protein [Anaerolineae bacterium]|nr:PAS domain-containing protein [Anaerolineae bacterium]